MIVLDEYNYPAEATMERQRRQQRQRIRLRDEERKILQQIVRKRTEKHAHVIRAKIILYADQGQQHQEIAQQLKIQNNMVTTWVARWNSMPEHPVPSRLQDLPRAGAPDKFTPEQCCKIIAIACEDPEEHGYPITHWTQNELAAAVVKEGIVDSISPSWLGRMLKKKIYSRTEVATG
jgi:transposase